MDTLLLSGIDQRHKEQLDRNPEAIFDILTMNSHKGRKINAAFRTHILQDGHHQNEAEFEAFVQQFPIDDSISECFAFASESENKSSAPKFVTGAKRPQVSKYSKLKKKLGWGNSEESLNIADDSMSRETKRSKKGGGVQSKRHKWRTPVEKTVNFSDVSEFDSVDEFSGAATANQKVPQKQNYSKMAVNHSVSGSSEQSHSTISGHVSGADDVFVSGSSGNEPTIYEGPNLPPVPPKPYIGRVPDYVNVGLTRKDDCFNSILVQDPVVLMKNLEELSADVAIETRDHRGNTLLHRCVEMGSPDGVYLVLDRFPTLSSDMNSENMTAIELAVKLGQVGCLKVMLDRNQKHKALGTPLLNRLLNISGSNGQHECLKLLLGYIPSDHHSTCTLPGDSRGNTAAHVSAKNGHLKCLQTLVAAGFDVTSENLIHQRPLQVAHQNSRHNCFAYLMLLDVCEKLLCNSVAQTSGSMHIRHQTVSAKTSIEQLMSYLGRYQKLLEEAKESLVENRESILETLVNIHEDLILVSQKSGTDSAEKQAEIKNKLDELAGEIERLEDTFEFSAIEDVETILSRVAQSLEEALVDISAGPENETSTTAFEEELRNSLSKLLRDVHEDAMAENWNTKQKVDECVNVYLKTGVGAKSITSPRLRHTQDSNVIKHSYEKTSPPVATELEKSNGSFHSEDKHEPTMQTSSGQRDRNSTDLHASAAKLSKDKAESTEIENGTKPSVVKGKSKPTWANLGQQKPQKSIETDKTNEQKVHHDNRKLISEQNKQTHSSKADVIDIDRLNNTFTNTTNLETEPVDIRKLSLDERMDLLIAGERAKEKLEDAEYLYDDYTKVEKSSDTVCKQAKFTPLSPAGTGSVCTTTTFTSITSDSSEGSSDFQPDFSKRKKRKGKFSFTSSSTDGVPRANLVPVTMDSTDSVTSVDLFTLTSDSTSYWWDVEDESPENKPADFRDYRDRMPSGGLKLLQEENLTNEELRRRRVIQHIKALQRTRFPSNEFAEKITTSSGEIMGGFETADKGNESTDITERGGQRIVVDVDSALRAREGLKPVPMPRRKKKATVSDSEDSIDTHSLTDDAIYRNFGAVDQDLSSLDVQWEDMYMSDDDTTTINGKPWYEMSDDDDVSVVPSWRSDDDTEGSRTPRLI